LVHVGQLTDLSVGQYVRSPECPSEKLTSVNVVAVESLPLVRRHLHFAQFIFHSMVVVVVGQVG
jgi:hypothetical protein